MAKRRVSVMLAVWSGKGMSNTGGLFVTVWGAPKPAAAVISTGLRSAIDYSFQFKVGKIVAQTRAPAWRTVLKMDS